MSSPPLPDRWEDEPWPLDDPVPAPSLRPTNWSDTHAEPPQVGDLADEAWQYAVDHGISMERALVEMQRERLYDQAVLYGSGQGVALRGISISQVAWVPVTRDVLDDMQRAWTAVQQTLSHSSPIVAQFDDWAKRHAGDEALDDVMRAPIVPSWQWDACVGDDE